MWELCR